MNSSPDSFVQSCPAHVPGPPPIVFDCGSMSTAERRDERQKQEAQGIRIVNRVRRRKNCDTDLAGADAHT